MKIGLSLISAAVLCASTAAFADANNVQYAGYSLVINQASSLGIAVRGGAVDDMSPVIQYTGVAKDNHLVKFVPINGSRHMIEFKSSQKCVSLNGYSSVIYRDFVQWSCIGADTQAFMILPNTDGTVSFRVRTSEQCLTGSPGGSRNGLGMVQTPCTPGNPAQRFYIVNVAN